VAKKKQRSRFFVFLREVRGRLFDDAFQAELEMAYAPRGQEPVPPALLAMVTLLQAYTGVSDAEAVEAAQMDMRWKLVLGTLGQEDAPFGQGSLVRFRARVVERDLDQRLVDRTVELARTTGGFGWQKLRVAMDSSPLSGAGRVEDSWNLIGRAMTKLVAVLARLAEMDEEQVIEETGADVLCGPSLKAALDLDWDDDAERSRALGRVVAQAQSLVAWAEAHLPNVVGDALVQEAVSLLKTVIAQNTEPDPDTPGGRRVPQGVPRDRICSVGDSEMRHGRKSSTKAFNGYKRHIVTLVDAPLVLGAVALPANQPENEAVPLLLDTVRRHGPVEELFIDRGYVSHDEVARLFRNRVPIRCRPWPVNNRNCLFTKDDFEVNLRTRHVTCPADITVEYSPTDRIARFGENCASCRLRSSCTTAKGGRTLAVHPQEALLRVLQRGVASSRGRELLRTRVAVEHRLARIQQFQGGRSRYFGVRKNTLDLRRHAAVANLVELQHALAA
jgi:hypothetical protein